MSFTTFIIFTQTMINEGPMVHAGTLDNRGVKNSGVKKHNPTITAVNPGRPPAMIPVDDSTCVAIGETPSTDPMTTEPASAI